jgi:hypothetical protein
MYLTIAYSNIRQLKTTGCLAAEVLIPAAFTTELCGEGRLCRYVYEKWYSILMTKVMKDIPPS